MDEGADGLQNLYPDNPFQKLIFVLEMVVKRRAYHSRLIRHCLNCNFLNGLLASQFLKTFCQQNVCCFFLSCHVPTSHLASIAVIPCCGAPNCILHYTFNSSTAKSFASCKSTTSPSGSTLTFGRSRDSGLFSNTRASLPSDSSTWHPAG